MKKVIFCVFLTITGLFTLFPEGKKEISIGFVADLSGRGSELWVNARNGILLGIQEFNENDYPFTLNLEVRDDKGDAELLKQYMEELIDSGIFFFIGPTTSGNAMVLEEYFTRDDLLFLSATVSTNQLTGRDDSLIRTAGLATMQGKQLAEAAMEREGDRSFVIVIDSSNISYTGMVSTGFQRFIAEREGTILGEFPYNSSKELDYLAISQEVLSLDPDGVLIIGKDLDCAALMQQIFKNNEDIHYYTPSWANTNEFIINTGKAGEGSYQIGSFDYTSSDPRYLAFKEAYVERFSTEPLFTAAMYYEDILFLTQALEGEQDWDNQKIKGKMLSSGLFESFLGVFNLDEYGDIVRDYILVQFQNGEPVILQ